ncbi:MAG TPA: ATP-binding protein [Bacteroidales bacterium]|nr:ATP-binding protein [Bacteroidales bacterium]HPM91777.1 ATP-binding protein [Bacteroidales bacterium]
MRDLLKTVIADQLTLTWSESFTSRNVPETLLKGEDIVVISGIRRCGKSTLLHQIRSGYSEKDYYMNFDDERLLNFKVENFQLLHETFIELFGQQKTFWFDEIQNVKGWERFVRRLHDYGNKVFITGSNATMLSRDLGTHLTGRFLKHELFPFSFREFLDFNNIKTGIDNIYSTGEKAGIKRLFNEYFKTGGFPYYLKYEDDNYLKSLYESILYRDIMAKHNLTSERELKELIYLLASNVSRPYSNNRLAASIGLKNATTVKNYLDYIQDTYLLFAVNKFDYSARKQLHNARKIYFIDNALIRKLGFMFSEDKGRMLENLVFIELQRRGEEVFYYKGKGECDFVLRDGNSITGAVQVTYSMTANETRDREIKGLLEAMDSYNLSEGIILTDDTEENLSVNGNRILIMPVYKWLLRI